MVVRGREGDDDDGHGHRHLVVPCDRRRCHHTRHTCMYLSTSINYICDRKYRYVQGECGAQVWARASHRQTRDTELLKNLFHKFPSPTRVRQQMVPSLLRGGPVVPPAWHCLKWQKSRRLGVPSSRQNGYGGRYPRQLELVCRSVSVSNH